MAGYMGMREFVCTCVFVFPQTGFFFKWQGS